MSAAVAARTTKPALSGVKAVAQDDSLTLTAYDMETGVRYALPGVTVSTSGSCILPIVELLKILRESDDPDITLAADGDTIIATTGGDRYEMPSLDVNEFPDIPSFDDTADYHEITSGDLRTMIGRTTFSADKKDTTAKFSLKGVLWEAEGTTARLVATDTKRLAVSTAPATVSGTSDSTAVHLVPLKAVALLEKNLDADDTKPVRVVLRPNDAMFRTDRAEIYTSLVQGKFPPYEKILDNARKSATQKIELPASAFLSRVRRAAIMVDAESQRIDMTFATGSVKLKARGANTGSSDVTLDLPNHVGETTEVAFDPVYLGEFLRAVDDGATVVMEMSDGKRPAMFTCGENYAFVVMPLTG